MATFRVPIFGWQIRPGAAGAVYLQGFDAFASNDIWKHIVAVWIDSSTKNFMRGSFEVPSNYANSPEIVVIWTSETTSNDVVWDFEYRVVSGNDDESLDQTSEDEAVSVTDVAPSAAFERLEAKMSLTGSHWSSNATCEYNLSRDGTNSSDTLADNALVFDVMFSYSDT